jgi:hypothetical protein
MHPPYHLYEFSRESFERHGKRVGYKVVAHQVFVCETFLPKPLERLVGPIMDATGTGMELQVWLAHENVEPLPGSGRQ